MLPARSNNNMAVPLVDVYYVDVYIGRSIGNLKEKKRPPENIFFHFPVAVGQ
jgi:hypothetical protein